MPNILAPLVYVPVHVENSPGVRGKTAHWSRPRLALAFRLCCFRRQLHLPNEIALVGRWRAEPDRIRGEVCLSRRERVAEGELGRRPRPAGILPLGLAGQPEG